VAIRFLDIPIPKVEFSPRIPFNLSCYKHRILKLLSTTKFDMMFGVFGLAFWLSCLSFWQSFFLMLLPLTGWFGVFWYVQLFEDISRIGPSTSFCLLFSREFNVCFLEADLNIVGSIDICVRLSTPLVIGHISQFRFPQIRLSRQTT
jgi:hypothetical protein